MEIFKAFPIMGGISSAIKLFFTKKKVFFRPKKLFCALFIVCSRNGKWKTCYQRAWGGGALNIVSLFIPPLS